MVPWAGMRSARPCALFALAATCFFVAGCDAVVARLRAGKDAGADAAQEPTASPAAAPTRSVAELEKTFASFDINDDAQLDGIEVTKCGCRNADTNGDGEITKAEYLAAALVPRGSSAAPAPAPAPAPSPAPATPPSPAPPTAEGMAVGGYRCSALVGGILSTTGQYRVLSSSTYVVGSTEGRYAFDPATGSVTWQSGFYADGSNFRSATYAPATKTLRMRTGKSGFTTWTCRPGG